MKSKLMKAAATGGIALAAVGIGAGVASAEPNHNQDPQSSWQQNRQDDHQQDHRNDRWDDRNHRWEVAPTPHGFWFFDRWIPTPW